MVLDKPYIITKYYYNICTRLRIYQQYYFTFSVNPWPYREVSAPSLFLLLLRFPHLTSGTEAKHMMNCGAKSSETKSSRRKMTQLFSYFHFPTIHTLYELSHYTPLPSAVHFPLLGRVRGLAPFRMRPCQANTTSPSRISLSDWGFSFANLLY